MKKTDGTNVSLKQYYQYDGANRLTQVAEYQTSGTPACPDGTSQWCENFGYDNFGNRLITARSGFSAPLNEPQGYNTANNRITGTGWQYDNGVSNYRGNITADPAPNSYTYDAESRLTHYSGIGATTDYSYDGDGQRVKKVSGVTTTVFVFDAAGELAAEYTTPAPGLGGRRFFSVDHLGSTRLITDAGGGVLERHDYRPFGDEVTLTAGQVRAGVAGYGVDQGTREKFTGKERDQETGLDFFQARYFGSSQGRFTSPDPGPWILLNPQSYNAYSYGLNNPLRYGDEDGLTPQDRINQANNLLGMNIPYSHQQSYISNPAEGLDCSGLAANVFHADPDNNVALTHNAAAQAAAFEAHGEFTTDVSQGQPGDAIYWSDSSGHIAHTGIVVDIRDGKIYFVHAPRPGKNVNKFWVPLSTGKLGNERFAGFGRPIEHPRNGRPQRVAAPGFRDVIEMLWMMYGPSSPNSEKPKKKRHSWMKKKGSTI